MFNKIKHFFLKKNILKKNILSRKDSDLKSLFNKCSLTHITYHEFKDIWEKIGKSYHINPKKLRLSDRFDHELNALDPWPVDGYITELEELLVKKHPNKSQKNKVLNTLKDYVYEYFSQD